MSRAVVTFALVLAGLCARTSILRAQTEPSLSADAQGHLDRGLALYQDKEFEGAISEFKAGYLLEARRVFLFAWAQAERLSGDCQSAVVLYRKFLGEEPPEAQATAARANLSRCEGALATRPEDLGELPGAAPVVEAAPPAAFPPDGSVTRPARTNPSSMPWQKDALGTSLMAGGAVGLGIGATFFLLSQKDQAAADSAENYGEYGTLIERAQDRRTLAYVLGASGAALAVGGVVHYVWLKRETPRPAVSVWVGNEDVGMALAGRF